VIILRTPSRRRIVSTHSGTATASVRDSVVEGNLLQFRSSDFRKLFPMRSLDRARDRMGDIFFNIWGVMNSEGKILRFMDCFRTSSSEGEIVFRLDINGRGIIDRCEIIGEPPSKEKLAGILERSIKNFNRDKMRASF